MAFRGASLPRHVVPGISLPTMAHDTVLFAPKCIVLLSTHDFPEVFRNCLGTIYTGEYTVDQKNLKSLGQTNSLNQNKSISRKKIPPNSIFFNF